MVRDTEIRNSRKLKRNFLWPKEDVWCWRHINKKGNIDLPYRIEKYCNQKTVVIQAGGNAGLYPYIYSSLFETVYTFEPDKTNYYCLQENNKGIDNVIHSNVALGSKEDYIDLEFNSTWNEKNTGAVQVSGSGDIKMITIDSLNLAPDLIHFDLEGFEGPALEGSINTIRSYRPVIALETNGSGDKYDWYQTRIDKMLYDEGYKIIEYGHDTIYCWEQK